VKLKRFSTIITHVGQFQIGRNDNPKVDSSTPVPSAIPTLVKTESVSENVVKYISRAT